MVDLVLLGILAGLGYAAWHWWPVSGWLLAAWCLYIVISDELWWWRRERPRFRSAKERRRSYFAYWAARLAMLETANRLDGSVPMPAGSDVEKESRRVIVGFVCTFAVIIVLVTQIIRADTEQWFDVGHDDGPPVYNIVQDNKIPTDLFGVRLGTVHHLKNKFATIPANKKTRYDFSDGGIYLFFEPEVEYPDFPYTEYPKRGNGSFTTSFYVYLLPLIPEWVTQLEDIGLYNLEWQVLLVEWQNLRNNDDGGAEDDERLADYLWAKDLCESFKMDLEVNPEILDVVEGNVSYQCTFSDQERELVISSSVGRQVALSFGIENVKAMSEAVSRKGRQIRANKTRP